MKTRILIILALAALCSCSEQSTPISTPAPVDDYISPDGNHSSSTENALLSIYNIDSLSEYYASPAYEAFSPEVNKAYTDLSGIAEAAGGVYAGFRRCGLPVKDRLTAVFVNADRARSVIITDSVALISLNHYLGASHQAYRSFPEYLRMYMEPSRIAVDLCEAIIVTDYPYRAAPHESTLLSKMLYAGAMSYVTEQVCRCTVAEALGITSAGLRTLEANESGLWRAVVERHWLYDTSSTLSSRLLGPTPQIAYEGFEAPSRAGRYLGYRIVGAYMKKHPDTSLQQLLSPDFYLSDGVLADSGYKI